MGRVTEPMLPFGYAYASLVWTPSARRSHRLVHVPGNRGSDLSQTCGGSHFCTLGGVFH